VLALAPGVWHGPIESGYGIHLVRVSRAVPPRPLPYEEARARLAELWRERAQRAVEAAYFRRVLDKYDVVIDESVRPLVGPLPLLGLKGEGE
jgi:parvulin-like peptidyl-prolyl isomerase